MNQISINPLPPSPSLQLLLTLTVNLKREDNNCNRHGNTGFQLYPACRQLKFNQPAAPSATAPEKLERLVTAAIRGRYSHGPNDGGTPIHVSGHRTVLTDQTVDTRRLAQALVVAPCTGATLARLAAGLSDTPVTLAAKSLLRVGSPVVLAVSTNDGLGASGENMARLCQRKHYYFVPYGQDDPFAKPQSLKADLALLPAAVDAALRGEQLQPVLLGQRNA